MTSIRQTLHSPVTEPSAWYAADLANDASWIYHFTATDIADFDRALVHLRAGDRRPGEYTLADFPAAVLDRIMPGVLHELEHGRGCVLLRGLPVERYDVETLKLLYWGFGAYVGQVISQNTKGDLLSYVTDFGNDYRANNVRGHTTRARIRPHTDSCDVVALLCVREAMSGGKSAFSSSMTIFNELLAHYPHYLAPLYEGFYFDLAGKGSTADPNQTTAHKVPVYSFFDDRLSCKFNAKQIIEGAPKANHTLSDLEMRAVMQVEALAIRDDICFEMDFKPGDIQLLNNHCILHARTEYEDHPHTNRKRLLLRQWWNLPNGRKLAPEFADRLGTGPRGGVTVRDDAPWPEGVDASDVK